MRADRPESKEWWHDAVIYQVYLRSFADASDDGVGDLTGLRNRLPYLADLGVDALWLNPFYPSPGTDHGYDVADYCDVDRNLGSLTEFDRLLDEAHQRSLRLIVDLVPNHTSSSHPWFRTALESPDSPERAYYLFRPASPDGGPPNALRSVFGGPAWTLDPKSGEYYLHLFDVDQPDLDWRNPAVHARFEEILRFWLDRGVDGFRIDVAHGLYKSTQVADPGLSPDFRCWEQPEVLEVYRSWRKLAAEYGQRLLVGELFLGNYTLDRASRYVGGDGLHEAFNFLLTFAPLESWYRLIPESLSAFSAEGGTPAWVLSNHDVVRHPSRFGGGALGLRRARAASMTLLALPGSNYLYQGEELGLMQSTVSARARQDPIFKRTGGRAVGRDGCRTPIPWIPEPPGYGFTTAAPWLPFGAGAARLCVAAQDKDPSSTLSFYRGMLRLRREWLSAASDRISVIESQPPSFAFCRHRPDSGRIYCILNADTQPIATRIDRAGARLLLASADGVSIEANVVIMPPLTTAWLYTRS